jgi:hypothetical protein
MFLISSICKEVKVRKGSCRISFESNYQNVGSDSTILYGTIHPKSKTGIYRP